MNDAQGGFSAIRGNEWEVAHVGDSLPPHGGGCWHLLKLTVVSTSGGLTHVVQLFSTLDIQLRRLEFHRQADGEDLARVAAWFVADARTSDLLHRKLTRLIEVVSVDEMITECASIRGEGEIS